MADKIDVDEGSITVTGIDQNTKKETTAALKPTPQKDAKSAPQKDSKESKVKLKKTWKEGKEDKKEEPTLPVTFNEAGGTSTWSIGLGYAAVYVHCPPAEDKKTKPTVRVLLSIPKLDVTVDLADHPEQHEVIDKLKKMFGTK